MLTLTTTKPAPCPPPPSIPGIPGVTKLKMTFYSSVPFKSSFSGVWNAKYNFPDGADTLKSLTVLGYTVAAGAPVLNYVKDSSGKITFWGISTDMTDSANNFYYFSVGYVLNGNAFAVIKVGANGALQAEDCALPLSAKFSTIP